MDSANQDHPANGTENEDQGPTAEDRKLLDRLVALWRSHGEFDLGTRLQTGKLLNERLGPPTASQPQGQRVMKWAAEELRIAESDLNRTRWFGHLFDDITALQQSHPEITNWTRFKEVLPSLMPAKGGQARKPAEDPSRPALGGVARSLANLTSKLNGLDIRPAGAERQKLVDALRGLAEAACRLDIPVKVAVRVKDSKPVVTKRTDRVARA
jgi:hypothetical protein